MFAGERRGLYSWSGHPSTDPGWLGGLSKDKDRQLKTPFQNWDGELCLQTQQPKSR